MRNGSVGMCNETLCFSLFSFFLRFTFFGRFIFLPTFHQKNQTTLFFFFIVLPVAGGVQKNNRKKRREKTKALSHSCHMVLTHLQIQRCFASHTSTNAFPTVLNGYIERCRNTKMKNRKGHFKKTKQKKDSCSSIVLS